ncbi:MAG TPA: L,D-transpeptidase [Beijerinckiaceae bacterium]|nr:L,D-transpeptidase [Beijerinckiaceae bacterium]
MRTLIAALALASGLLVTAAPANAVVSIHVDLSAQRMTVHADGQTYEWPVSTAREGYVTPRGTYRPTSLQLMHYSSKYENSPMPHSIFFRGGYAIHGTYETAHLGRAASHGCVRLSPANATLLYGLVKAEGATITISGEAPSAGYAAEPSPRRRAAARQDYYEQPPLYPPEPYGYENGWGRDPYGY